MDRRGLRRALASIAALWSVVVLSAPTMLQTCIMMQGAQSANHAHAGMAMHGSGATDMHTSHHRDGTPLCSCLGDCCVAPVANVPGLAITAPQTVSTLPEHVATAPRTQFYAGPVRYARPPTIGPPATTA